MKKHQSNKQVEYTLELNTTKSPKEVFDAVLNVRGWWSAKLVGSSKAKGDTFDFRYEDMHYSRQQIVEVIPNKKVVWLVSESSLSFVAGKKDEWSGTRISFEISQYDQKTRLLFTHHGLVPQFECFESCCAGWTHYLENSLLKLIDTGEGLPD